MSVIDNLIGLTSTITRPTAKFTKDQYLQHISTSYFHYIYLKYWKYANQPQKNRMLLATSIVLLSVYVLAPTLKYQLLSNAEKEQMFRSNRKDKLTIGLINTRNDCFANSSIQAFASLPGLNTYLNDVLKEYQTLLTFKDSIILKEEEKFPEVLLHDGLALIISHLQESISKSKSISVWPFLHVIERIYTSKISTAQNDAHELVQLILETLDGEIGKLKAFVKKHSNEIGVTITVPELPFNGLLADQLTCLSCSNSSKPTFYPFSVLSLPVPGTFTASLKEMIRSNEVETITGYNCLRCRVQAILKIEDEKAMNGVSISEETSQMVSELKVMESNLFINDDLTGQLEQFVKSYESNGFKLVNLTSTIVKKTLVIKPPNLLTVHLSRSLFIANQVKRNGCHVGFDDILDVNIDETLLGVYESQQRELRKKNRKVKVEDEAFQQNRLDPVELVRSHSKILAQTEEIEEFVENREDSASVEHQQLEARASLEINTGASTDSPPSAAASLQSNQPNTSTTDVTSVGSSDHASLSSSNSSIVSEQLNIHNNTVIRYKLKAMIRHQGTHNAGHYECYRHKPDFMKDSVDDSVVNLSTPIKLRSSSPTNASSGGRSEPAPSTTDKGPGSNVLGELDSKASSPRKLETSLSLFKGIYTPIESTSRASESEADETSQPSHKKERRRSIISSFVSQLSGSSSVSTKGSTPNINTEDHLADISESSPNLGSDSLTNENQTTNADTNGTISNGDASGKKSKKSINPEKRYKKISTVTKKPFWRISDTNINEVKMEDVLSERSYVYMIYYERVAV
ncbi:hypothetical protein WICPIJ_004236 [Wickerhamomyces pijperi]|uniref:ubiquitinyl hydrolase 1 n=1 Tax=Wickerhamomyces pijperi TaxID=599730 RepID=A0A9P8Q699_WICPI|nr:hypothetical protein WICPIJ_004236 [Wickerhamomyces pijperi]